MQSHGLWTERREGARARFVVRKEGEIARRTLSAAAAAAAAAAAPAAAGCVYAAVGYMQIVGWGPVLGWRRERGRSGVAGGHNLGSCWSTRKDQRQGSANEGSVGLHPGWRETVTCC